MKITIGLLLLASLTSSAFAETCQGSNCKTAGVSAAGMMVAGATAIRGSIAIRDIEKRFTRTLMQVSVLNPIEKNAVTDVMVNKIRPGDKVIITYSMSNHLNQNIETLLEIRGQIQVLATQANTLALQADQVIKGNTIGFHNPVGAQGEFKRMGVEYRNLTAQIEMLEEQKASLTKKMGITRSPVTKVILNANDNMIGGQIKEMLSAGKSIYSIKRVPNSVMQKIARASRNGYVLAATAVALGLVTVEELTSGRISRRLDGEFEKMK